MATETALELVATPQPPANLFGTTDPKAMIQEAAITASAMADVIRAKHLYKTIGAKNHVLLEGWTMLGAMRGVFASTVWTRPLEDGEGIRLGWEARVEARTLAGQLVGAAEASCLYAERNWKGKDDYAVRSMAQTRATSKALRMPLGFILVLAGYEACPAEEMPSEDLVGPLQASVAKVREERGEFSAPPLCGFEGCKSPVGRFESTQAKFKGRYYWQCQRANDRVLELEERGDSNQKQIHADARVAGHWRSWAEPWPRK